MTAGSTTAHPPAMDADPFSPANIDDPARLHAALRDAGSVVHLRGMDVYAVARYEEVHAALRDWQDFGSGAGVGLANFHHEHPWRPPSLLLEADPPRHDAPRTVLSRVLGPRTLRSLRASWFADAEKLVDRVLAGGEFDGVTDLAQAFPLRVFPDAVGIPAEGRENLLPYGDHVFNAFGPTDHPLVEKGKPRVAELSAWVAAQCGREVLSPDGFGARIWQAADHGDITREQAPLLVRSLLSAGVDTTVHGLAAVLYAFATHPEQWQRLRAEPHLARNAFDEAVRWWSPVQVFFRTATADTEIARTRVGEDRKILMFLGSANRDPRHWTDPDAFDLSRDPSGHVGFGMGIHQCVGQHVARLEAEAVLNALVQRVERFEIAGSVRTHPNVTLRALESLPLRAHRYHG